MSAHPVDSDAFPARAREREAQRLGMWIFLVSETLIFGPFIMAYLIGRWHFPNGFAHASAETSLMLGGINTAILLFSSLTMTLADIRAEEGHRSARRWLLLTALLGLIFLGIKGYEWSDEIGRGLAPFLGMQFRYDGPDPQAAALFYRAYFALTGLHAVHLGIGTALAGGAGLLWPRIAPRRRGQRGAVFSLYWHFVDVIWMFLFALLYLPGRSL